MFPKNDQLLTVTGLTDNTGALIVGATVTATLVDASGTPQTGCDNVTLTDVDDTPGSYSTVIDETFVSDPGSYTLQVSAVKDSLNLYVEKAVTVVTRTV
jgi:hypothetical protein